MNDENFNIQSSLEGNYLIVSLQEPVVFDEIAINVISSDCPPFLISFKIQNFNDRISLKYKLINTIALEYMELNCTKKEFIQLYLNLLIPFVKGNDWFLDYHNFCLNPRYIYVDKMYEVYYIYVPEKSYVSKEDEIIDFFKNIFSRSNIKDAPGFQVKMFQFFAKGNISLVQLYEMILEENKVVLTDKAPAAAEKINEPPKDTNIQYVQNTAPMKSSTSEDEKPVINQERVAENKSIKNGLFGSKHKKEKPVQTMDVFAIEDNEPSLENSEDAVIDALFGDKKKQSMIPEKTGKAGKTGSGLFGMKKKSHLDNEKQSVTSSFRETDMNQAAQPHFLSFNSDFGFHDDSDDEETVVLEDGSLSLRAYLELIDSPVNGALPYISLDFDTQHITIGRSSSDEIQPDVAFSREFKQMGRRHARIEKNNGKYYVIDLGSANHTILNGKTLVPNQMYELTDGGELVLTDSKPVRYRIHL